MEVTNHLGRKNFVMAASSSDDSSKAPKNFHISSAYEGCEGHLNSYSFKCPLCAIFRKTFYCRNCVKSGDFIHSAHHLPERLSEKQQKYQHLQASLKKCNDRCTQLLKRSKTYENLKYEIKKKKEKIAFLGQLVSNTKRSIGDKEIYRESLLKANDFGDKVLPKYELKMKNLNDYTADRLVQVSSLTEKDSELKVELKQTIRGDIQKLIKYIFPIYEIVLRDETQEEVPNVSDTVAALADAKNTSYIRGKWIFHGSGISELQHCIVAPSLPANGDYSSYLDWLAENKDGVHAASEIIPSNVMAFRITAALKYATQLVNLLSYYLDVRLPHKLAYGDFCKRLNEPQFTRKVSRLNTNIMYLAYTQRVKLSLLNENHTLENILAILDMDISDLGHFGPVDVSNAPLTRSVDSQVLLDLETGTESESEDENSIRLDWEAVPLLTSHDTSPPLLSSNQQTTSIAGGLMTSAAASIASFLRGWSK